MKVHYTVLSNNNSQKKLLKTLNHQSPLRETPMKILKNKISIIDDNSNNGDKNHKRHIQFNFKEPKFLLSNWNQPYYTVIDRANGLDDLAKTRKVGVLQ